MQLATFLLDYACFMNSSDLLQTYLDSKARLSKLSLADFDSIQDFSDQEIACYNDHEIAAASALRSVLDPVDRGNNILHSLSSELQDKINKRGRKGEIPENCKDRNWLIQALTKLSRTLCLSNSSFPLCADSSLEVSVHAKTANTATLQLIHRNLHRNPNPQQHQNLHRS